MRLTFLLSLFASLGLAQTAIVPASAICPVGQLTIATKTATLGTSVIVKLSCVALDASVKLDAAAVPPTIKATGVAAASVGIPLCIPYYGLFQEAPAGAIDGINKIFVLGAAPLNNILIVVVDGSVQALGSDYSSVGNQITFTVAPAAGAVIRVYYRS